MQAIQITQTGSADVLVLQEVSKPIVRKGEVLVRMKSAGVNFIDIYMRKGDFPVPLPFIPGMEGAGIVEEIAPDVTDVRPGDRVAYVGKLGSYAQYATVPAAQLIPLPDSMDFDHGAAFALQGMTALYLVEDLHPIKPGDEVLVHAAAGGMGLLLVQWLKHKGARVIGTVSSAEKAAIAKQAGADEVILYTQQDFVAETLRLTGGKGAHYIIDGVGKDTLTKDLKAVRARGAIAYYGLASGQPEPIDAGQLQNKSICLCGGNLMNYLAPREELMRRASQVLWALKDGWLQLNIGKVYPLAEAAEAHRLLESRASTGKLILHIEK